MLKPYKKICKYSNGVQCFKCFSILNATEFLAHIEVCQSVPQNKPHFGHAVSSDKHIVRTDPLTANYNSGSSAAPLSQPQGIRFKIESLGVVNEKPKSFIEYKIRVTSGARSWIIKKKYKDFNALYERLCAEEPQIALPQSSKIVQTSTFTPSIMKDEKIDIEEKKKNFELFLNDLAASKAVAGTAAFKEFIEDGAKRLQSAKDIDQQIPELDDDKQDLIENRFKAKPKPKEAPKSDFMANIERQKKNLFY